MAPDDGSPGTTPRPDQAHLRASDADRQRIADRLRRAVDEGRLTLHEYDERLAATYTARTYGELAEVIRDLPPEEVPDSLPSPAPSPPSVRDRRRAMLVRQGKGWLGGAVMMNGIWAATSGLDWSHYWPGVVLPIWGAVILGGAISRSSGEGEDPDARRSGRPRRGRANR